MINSSATVSAELGLSLVVPDHGAVPLVASLHYSADDPYAIRMSFHVGTDEPVEWIFARDLLAVGLEGPAGEGDVQVWPTEDHGRELLNIALSPRLARLTSRRRALPLRTSSAGHTRSSPPARRATSLTSTASSTSCSGAHRRNCPRIRHRRIREHHFTDQATLPTSSQIPRQPFLRRDQGLRPVRRH
jgi:Streptomyces sporulation and cell division protein, SsgA